MRAVPRLCEYYPGICLTTEVNARKTLSEGKKNLGQGKKTHCQSRERNNKLRCTCENTPLFSSSTTGHGAGMT